MAPGSLLPQQPCPHLFYITARRFYCWMFTKHPFSPLAIIHHASSIHPSLIHPPSIHPSITHHPSITYYQLSIIQHPSPIIQPSSYSHPHPLIHPSIDQPLIVHLLIHPSIHPLIHPLSIHQSFMYINPSIHPVSIHWSFNSINPFIPPSTDSHSLTSSHPQVDPPPFTAWNLPSVRWPLCKTLYSLSLYPSPSLSLSSLSS